MEQTSSLNTSLFTKDSIAKYSEDFKKDPMTTTLKSFEASGYNYLVPYYLTHNIPIDSTDEQLSFAYQTMRTTFSSFAGDVRENETAYIATRHWDTAILTDTNFTPLDARSEIAAIAQKRQVIMINESHIDPRGRLFVSSILPILKAKGFTYLFIEGLRENGVNERGFPLQTSGFYTSEPLFNTLIRQAIRLGFKLIPYDCYESPCATVPEREQTQAEHIYEIIKKDPQAKALVFAGHGHINKDPEKNWMAHRFKKLSGIDPFCINQAINSEAPQLFHRIRKEIKKPVIYKNIKMAAYRAFSQINQVDATIVFPDTKWIDRDYAAWMLRNGSVPYRINLAGSKYEGTLLTIIKSTEFDLYGEKAIPVRNMLLKKTNHQELLLDTGSYYVRVIDLYGNEIHKDKIQL